MKLGASARLTIEVPHSQNLFKQTERLLAEPRFQRALEYVASREKMATYCDMVDYLFCELVLGQRVHCLRFYRGEGPPLREMTSITPQQLATWDIFLASALQIAHAAMEQRQELSLRQVGQATTEALKQAAG